MNMKPNVSQLLFASRYMLPLWIGFGVWLWVSGEAAFHWQRFDDTGKVTLVLFLCALVVGIQRAFPKVWAYEQAKRKDAAARRDPEEVKRRRLAALMLLAVASWGGSLWWVVEKPYAAQPDVYLIALIIAAVGSLWAGRFIYSRLPVSLQSRLRGIVSRKEKPFIVRWTLPVPKRSPNRKQIHAGLPDYCKLVLAPRPKEPMLARIQKAVEAQFLDAANS